MTTHRKPKPRTTLRANTASHTLVLHTDPDRRPVILDVDLGSDVDPDDAFDALMAHAMRHDPRFATLDLDLAPVPHPDDDAWDIETFLRFKAF